jgi:hypothetical protein
MLSDFSTKVAVPQEKEKLEVFTDGNDDYVYRAALSRNWCKVVMCLICGFRDNFMAYTCF